MVVLRCSTSCCSSPTSTERRLYEQGEWQCPWFSKEPDLLMPSFPCIPLNQSCVPYCTLQTNFCTTFTWTYFSILIIFDFFFFSFYFILFYFFPENASLCFALAEQWGQRSGWSWQGFSVLLKDTWADWVIAAVGLEPSSGALQPLTLTVDMNFKVSVLHGIFLSCTFVLGFS